MFFGLYCKYDDISIESKNLNKLMLKNNLLVEITWHIFERNKEQDSTVEPNLAPTFP